MKVSFAGEDFLLSGGNLTLSDFDHWKGKNNIL